MPDPQRPRLHSLDQFRGYTVAGMFLVSGALFQAVNLGSFLLTSVGDHAPRHEAIDPEDMVEEEQEAA